MQIAKFSLVFSLQTAYPECANCKSTAMSPDLTIQLTIRPTDSLPAEVLAKICRKAHRAGISPAEYIADVLRRSVRPSSRRSGRAG
jgi:hypothetical protein